MPLESTAPRAIRRHGELVTVRNYSRGAEDAVHGDAERSLDDKHTDVPARVDAGGVPEERRRQAHTTLSYDVTFTLPEDETAVAGLAGSDETAPASELERAEGDTYRAVRSFRDRNGTITVFAEVLS